MFTSAVAATAQGSFGRNSKKKLVRTDSTAQELNIQTLSEHQQFFSSLRSSEGEQRRRAACLLQGPQPES